MLRRSNGVLKASNTEGVSSSSYEILNLARMRLCSRWDKLETDLGGFIEHIKRTVDSKHGVNSYANRRRSLATSSWHTGGGGSSVHFVDDDYLAKVWMKFLEQKVPTFDLLKRISLALDVAVDMAQCARQDRTKGCRRTELASFFIELEAQIVDDP